MSLPPVTQECCGTRCMFEDDEKFGPCWGKTQCVDSTPLDDGDEIRHAACEGHEDC